MAMPDHVFGGVSGLLALRVRAFVVGNEVCSLEPIRRTDGPSNKRSEDVEAVLVVLVFVEVVRGGVVVDMFGKLVGVFPESGVFGVILKELFLLLNTEVRRLGSRIKAFRTQFSMVFLTTVVGL